jgi:hypothetical protein
MGTLLKRRLFAATLLGLPLLSFAPVARAQDAAALPSLPAGDVPPPPPPPPAYAPPPPPPASAGLAAAPARGEEVRFEPSEPGLALLMRTGEVPMRRLTRFRYAWYYEHGHAPVYAPVCNAPCATELVPGEYHFALSKDGGRPVPAASGVLSGPAVLRADYIDKSGVRTAGAVIGIGGLIGGIVMIVASVGSDQVCNDAGSCYPHDNVNGTLLGGGIAVLLGSAILGSILGLEHDEAHLTIEPLRQGTLGPGAVGKESARNDLGASPIQGAGLTLRF